MTVYPLTHDVPKFLDELSNLFEKHGMVLATEQPGQAAYSYVVLSHGTGRLMARAHLKGRLILTDKVKP
jgi:hypothetical protein